MRTLPSMLALARRLPSGLKLTPNTASLWPRSTARTPPVTAFQTRTV